MAGRSCSQASLTCQRPEPATRHRICPALLQARLQTLRSCCLTTQPRNAAQAAARGVALQLSGHTHGGMILGLDRLVARANNGFVSGRYTVGGMTLYVNNGTALWPGFALRLGRPSELTRIILRRALQQVGHSVPPAIVLQPRVRASTAP
jgi:uncharacterized protein